MIGRTVKLAIAAIFYCIWSTARAVFVLAGKRRPATLVILTYHVVKGEDAARFSRQMGMLSRMGRPVSLEEGIDAIGGGHHIAISFDDAFQSVLANALPVLTAMKLPATIFVPSGFLGKVPSWVTSPTHPYAGEIVATEEQLKQLAGGLISIGSHTVNHINLTNVDASVARFEIFDSKSDLEAILGREVRLFAAPFATLDSRLEGLFVEAGYTRVFTNIPTFPASRTDLYVLGRTSVEPGDWPLEFYLKCCGAYQWMPLAVSLKKWITGRHDL